MISSVYTSCSTCVRDTWRIDVDASFTLRSYTAANVSPRNCAKIASIDSGVAGSAVPYLTARKGILSLSYDAIRRASYLEMLRGICRCNRASDFSRVWIEEEAVVPRE